MNPIPFAWPEYCKNPSDFAKAMVGMPFICIYKRAYRQFRKEQKERGDIDPAIWASDELECWIRGIVDDILVNEMEWVNTRFLPDDPCDILFFDPTMDLLAAGALMAIQSRFRIDISITDLSRLTYIQLVEFIRKRSNQCF